MVSALALGLNASIAAAQKAVQSSASLFVGSGFIFIVHLSEASGLPSAIVLFVFGFNL